MFRKKITFQLVGVFLLMLFLVTMTPVFADDNLVIKDAVIKFYQSLASAPIKNFMIPATNLNQALTGNPQGYLVIDTRKPQHYAEGHINGAINIPLKELGVKLDLIAGNSAGKTIVAVDYNGQTATQVVTALRIAGLDALMLRFGMADGAGGLQGWNYFGLPLTTTEVCLDANLVSPLSATVLGKAAADYFNNLPAHNNLIEPADVQEALSMEPEDYIIIDIRLPIDFSAGHIEGAINIPFGTVGSNLDYITQLAAGKTALIACYTGHTSSEAVASLQMAGINARSLTYGMNLGWKVQGFPVVQ